MVTLGVSSWHHWILNSLDKRLKIWNSQKSQKCLSIPMLLPKKKKRMRKRKKSPCNSEIFFHILPLSETSPFKKRKKKAGAPRFAVRNDLQDDSWSFRCDTQSWSQVPNRIARRCGRWDGNHQGMDLAQKVVSTFKPNFCYLHPENWRKWSNLTHIIFLQMGGSVHPPSLEKVMIF